MTDPLVRALGEDALADLQGELEDLRIEVQAHADGIGHLAQDPMHAGQLVHVYDYSNGEQNYRLQVTHAETPVWQCSECRKLTVSPDPAQCAGCGKDADEVIGPLLYEQDAACRSWSADYGGQYDGPCLIAGWDGCNCPEEVA